MYKANNILPGRSERDLKRSTTLKIRPKFWCSVLPATSTSDSRLRGGCNLSHPLYRSRCSRREKGSCRQPLFCFGASTYRARAPSKHSMTKPVALRRRHSIRGISKTVVNGCWENLKMH